MTALLWVATLLVTTTSMCPVSKGQLLGCYNDNNGVHLVEYDYTIDPPQVCRESILTIQQGKVGQQYKCQGMAYVAKTDTLYVLLVPNTTMIPSEDVWLATIDLAMSTAAMIGSPLGLPVVELFTYGDGLYGSVSSMHPSTGYYVVDVVEGRLGHIVARRTASHQTPFHGVVTLECLRGFFRLMTSQGQHYIDIMQEIDANEFTTVTRKAKQHFPGNPTMVYSATMITDSTSTTGIVVVSTSQGVYFNYSFTADPIELHPNTHHVPIWGLTHLAAPVVCDKGPKIQKQEDMMATSPSPSPSTSSSPSPSSSPSENPEEFTTPSSNPSDSPSSEPSNELSEEGSDPPSEAPSSLASPEPSESDTPSPFSLQPAPGLAIESPVPIDVTLSAACDEVRSSSTSVVCTLTASAAIFKSNLAINIPRGFTITFPVTFQASVFVIIWIGANDGDTFTISTRPPLVIETTTYTVANDDPPASCNVLAQGRSCQAPATVMMGHCQCPVGSPCESTGQCTRMVDTDTINTVTVTGGVFQMISSMVEATLTQLTIPETTTVSSTTSQSARVNRVRVTRTVMRITIQMTMVVATLSGPASVESTTVIIMVRVTVLAFVHLTPFLQNRLTSSDKFHSLQSGTNFTIQTSLTVGTPTMAGTVPTLVQGTTLINVGSSVAVESLSSFCGDITMVSSEIVIMANTTIKANVFSNGAGRLVVNNHFLLLQTANMIQAITVVMATIGMTQAGIVMEVGAIQNTLQVGPGVYFQNVMQQPTVAMQDTFRMESTGIIDLGNVTTTSSPITCNTFDTVGDYNVILRPVVAPQVGNTFRIVTFTSRTGTGSAIVTVIPFTSLSHKTMLSTGSLDVVFDTPPSIPPVPTSATAPPVNPAPPQAASIPSPVLTTTATTSPPPSSSGGGSSIVIPIVVSVGLFILLAGIGVVGWRVFFTSNTPATVPKPFYPIEAAEYPQYFSSPPTPQSTPMPV